VHTTEKEKS